MDEWARPAVTISVYDGSQQWRGRVPKGEHFVLAAEMDGEASKACATPLGTKVNWSALSDEQLMSLSVPSFCGEVVSQMAYLCGKDDRYKAEAKTLKGVDCRFGEGLKLHEKDGQLLFTTHPQEANQGDFINAILRNR